MKDIETIEDIELLVNTFYNKVKKDDVIGFFFNDVAKTNWEVHLPKMYLFWRALLFMDIKFDGNPVGAHIPINLQVPMEEHHFDHWVGLWKETVNELFEGETAEDAKNKGQNIAKMMAFKMRQVRM